MNPRQARNATLPTHHHDPAFDPTPHHSTRSKSSLRFFRSRPVRLAAAAAVAGLLIGAVQSTRAAVSPHVERLARVLGFGVDQVTLVGHQFSFDSDIFDALDLANVRTFAALDTAAVKARIERLPWVETAELSRVYPGRLDIRVTERKPTALWTRGDRNYLIDKTGRVLAAVNGESLPNLPRFSGEGAADNAAELSEHLARYPDVSGRLALAERISERRWRLKLVNGTTLELPADDEVGALEQITRDPALVKLVAEGRTTLDFRGPGRLAVRPEADAAAVPTASPGS